MKEIYHTKENVTKVKCLIFSHCDRIFLLEAWIYLRIWFTLNLRININVSIIKYYWNKTDIDDRKQQILKEKVLLSNPYFYSDPCEYK